MIDRAQRVQDMQGVLDLLAAVNRSLIEPAATINVPAEIRITRVLADEATAPRNDGTPGSALYALPLQLSRTPSAEWADLFVETWNSPPRFTTMHRPGIARVRGDRIILDGTTIDEVERYHRETLMLVIQRVNAMVAERERARAAQEERRRQELENHKETLREAAARLRFD